MNLPDELKLIGLGIPLALVVLRWLRSHNDRELSPPSKQQRPVDDGDIEQLVRADRYIEAIKAARQRYGFDLKRAKLHVDGIRERLKSR